MKYFFTSLLMLCAFGANAQQPAPKPVRIISAFPTALAPDASARVLAGRLATIWNRPVQVEPMPGASGFIAIAAVKRAPADGTVLLLGSNGHFAINPVLMNSLPYDGEADFVPVSLMYKAPFFLYISATGRYRTLQELLTVAKGAPEKVTYSTPYVGSPPHLGGAMLAHLSGTKMLPVQYKEFSQVLSGVVSGDIDFTVALKGSANGLVKAGRLKRIAAMTPNRIASEPDVPTLTELGLPAGMDINSWVGLFAPRGTPADIVKKYGADIAKVIAEPEVRVLFDGMGVEPSTEDSAAVTTLIREELARNRTLIKRVGIMPE